MTSQEFRYVCSEGLVTDDDILSCAREIITKRFERLHDALTEPSVVREYVMHLIGQEERELFLCLFLDNKHKPIATEIVAYGSVSSATVYPREIVKLALRHNAAALIVAHNHPSGVAEPSSADFEITERVKEALKLVDIRLLDHVVCGGVDFVSFAERGRI